MANDLKVSITGDGKPLNSELTKVASEIAKVERQSKLAKTELNNLNKNINGVVGGVGNLSNAFRTGNITSFATGISSLGGNLRGLIPIFGNVGAAGMSMGTMLNAALGPIGLITSAIAAIGAVTVGAVKSVSSFEEHLDQLQSLTGLDDIGMESVSQGAIEMSKNFRASASDIVDSMKLIGSQAPELLKNSDALMAVTNAANVLAEAAGIEVVDAAKGLTTVMNQMGVSASKADEIINVLAASSQKGSADVAFLNTAFEKAGTVANNAGLSYQQLASAVETVAPKFGSADQAGTSLAATFKALEKQTNDNLKPSVVGIDQALQNLANQNLSTAEMIKLFGDAGYIAADALIKQREEFKNLTDEISGTETAYEQMSINNDNLAGSFNKLKSQFEALILDFGKSEYIQNIISQFKKLMEIVGHLIKVVFDLVKAILSLTSVKAILAALYVAWQTIVTAIDAVITIVEVLVALWNKGMNFMKGLINKFYNAIQNNAVFKWIKDKIQSVLNWALKLINKIKEVWNKFLDWIGVGGNGGSITISTTIEDNTSNATKLDENTSPDNAPKAGKAKTKGKGKTSNKSTKTTKTEVVKTQLELNEEELQKQENAVKKGIERFNKGLIDKNELESITKNANEYFEKNNIKEKVKLEFDKDENGFEKVKEITTPIKLPTELEIKRETFNSTKQILDQAKSDFNNNLIDKTELEKQVEECNKILKEIGAEPIIIDFKTNGIDYIDEATQKLRKQKEEQEYTNKVTQKNKEAYSALSSTFGSLGNAIGGTAGKFTELAGQTIAAIGEIIPKIVALISAKEGEALASGTASAAQMPFPANIAAIASIVATITALFASFAGSFASGGIIGGKTTIGDFNIARVNKGEMILNNRQQGKLFNILNGNGFYSPTNSGGEVQFKISGTNLVGILNNYNNKMKRVK